MKKKVTYHMMQLTFLPSLLLIISGVYLGARTFSHFEELSFYFQSHEQLLQSMEATAVYFMLFGGMVILGICILVVLLLRLGRSAARIHREAEALQRKIQAVEDLNFQTQKLAHHQRLETIGTLTSSIAHEFNNLLTPIMGYSLMALENLNPEEEGLYDDLLEIYNASCKAKEIISRLNDLSRKNTELVFRQVSPDELVRKTLSVANPAKPAKVEVKLDLNCWDQRLRANEIQLNQLLLNLILNGFHAMGEQPGILTVSTGYDEENIHICVSDTGCGIPQESLSRIFEPFYTTKEADKGTGLGLAIVAQVVEDHNGSVKVESTPGNGSSFFVRLPRHEQGEQ